MRNKIGMIFMSLGTLLLAGAVSLLFWNQNENRKADEASQEILHRIVEEAEIEENVEKTLYEETMPEKVIDGYGYIGYLTVPSLGLELPIMSDWSYAKLRIAPCRYSGSTVTDDLVIAAHNYASHFGRLKELKTGESVLFTDMNGKARVYETVEINIMEPTDVEEMTSGEFAISLFTCTYGGKSRLTIRCIERK